MAVQHEAQFRPKPLTGHGFAGNGVLQRTAPYG
jgi:hypothetical protein